MIYICSDSHIAHDNVIRFDKKRWERFSTIKEHDDWILKQRQSLDSKDEIYFLWDLVWKMDRDTEEKLQEELGKVKAKMYWIRWNHDYERIVTKYQYLFERVKDYHELKYNKRKFCLMHYPMQSWNGSCKSNIMLHWHCHQWLHRKVKHNKIQKLLLNLIWCFHLLEPRNRLDISFNGWKFLWTLEDILDHEKIKWQKKND